MQLLKLRPCISTASRSKISQWNLGTATMVVCTPTVTVSTPTVIEVGGRGCDKSGEDYHRNTASWKVHSASGLLKLWCLNSDTEIHFWSSHVRLRGKRSDMAQDARSIHSAQ